MHRGEGQARGLQLTITDCLREVKARLMPAGAIARAGRACAEAGEEHEALRIVMDFEQLTHEAGDLLGVAARMGRMERARAPLG